MCAEFNTPQEVICNAVVFWIVSQFEQQTENG